MTDLRERARRAREASQGLARAGLAARDAALRAAAVLLRQEIPAILAANAADVELAVRLASEGELPASALDRLRLDPGKAEQMALGLEAVAALPDPLDRVDLRRLLDDGLLLERVTVPLGVLAVIFESRPDAAVQIGALAIKSGNAALLKGGREAARSVAVLVEILGKALEAHGLPAAAVQVLQGRGEVDELLAMDDLVALVIPRGSSDLVRSIKARTRIPVLGHAEGVCHMYLDAGADAAMAVALVRDAKLQYPAACNALEALLVHQDRARELLPLIAGDLGGRAELRGCPRSRAIVPAMAPAAGDDWGREFGGAILAVKVVDSLDEALAHIARFGSGHTEAIVTRDAAAAARFLAEVDAAGVYHNASTRFADGYRYGFGAEVGISTSRIHARGPVGLEGLVTVKYRLTGEGHCVSDYSGPQAKAFKHLDLDQGRTPGPRGTPGREVFGR